MPPEPRDRASGDLDARANIYGLAMALEVLECMFAQNEVSLETYNEKTQLLLAQYRISERLLASTVTLRDVLASMRATLPAAEHRIEVARAPEAADLWKASPDPWRIAEATQLFVTLIDALALGLLLVRDLVPRVRALLHILRGIRWPQQSVAAANAAIAEMKPWEKKLLEMPLGKEPPEDEQARLGLSINESYFWFSRSLREWEDCGGG